MSSESKGTLARARAQFVCNADAREPNMDKYPENQQIQLPLGPFSVLLHRR
jgi:hypothetical protein